MWFCPPNNAGIRLGWGSIPTHKTDLVLEVAVVSRLAKLAESWGFGGLGLAIDSLG